MAYMGLGNSEEAIICFDKALKLEPNFVWALDNMCMAMLLSEDTKNHWIVLTKHWNSIQQMKYCLTIKHFYYPPWASLKRQ